MADPEDPGPQGGESAATPPTHADFPQPPAQEGADDTLPGGADSARECAEARERKAKFQLELFWRELNEVHLLLDFVSGRNDKSLVALTGIPDPAGPGSGGVSAPLSWDQVVDRICAIRFPPEGTPESTAQDAAFLLMVKDRLNGIAEPAKGLSIAYTAMFSGVALSGRAHAKSIRRTEPPSPTDSHAEGEKGRHEYHDFKRNPPSYAREAYPNLEPLARQFKRFFDALPWLALVWALITGLVYWDTALSNSILQQIAKADMDVVSLLQNNPTLSLADGVCPRQIPSASQAIPCQKLQTLRLQQALAREDLAALASDHWGRHAIGTVTRMFAPAELFDTAGHGCFSTFAATIGGALPPAEPTSPSAQPSLPVYLRAVKYCEAFSPSALEQMAAAVTSVFSIYVVPMMFGLLGTLAGLVRAITWKVRESTLSPRDHRLFLATIPLGVVAGLTIGLIFSSPGAYSQTVTGLPQSITLSAAAFAFLAGYGADSFFVMIDNLLKRIFAVDKSSSGKP